MSRIPSDDILGAIATSAGFVVYLELGFEAGVIALLMIIAVGVYAPVGDSDE